MPLAGVQVVVLLGVHFGGLRLGITVETVKMVTPYTQKKKKKRTLASHINLRHHHLCNELCNIKVKKNKLFMRNESYSCLNGGEYSYCEISVKRIEQKIIVNN